MAHWGWYWRIKKKYRAKQLCSKLSSIDSFKMLQAQNATGFSVQPSGVKATIEGDFFKIAYGKRKQVSYTIPIDKQACNYGGFRYYFKCPLCQKRMRKLYFAESSIFLCRKCLNLSYETQRMRPSIRFSYMSVKIKNLIKEKNGGNDIYHKPPKMHKTKYQALKNKQFDYEIKAEDALKDELREWYGARIDPYL